jgi:hypothetical protein
MGGKGLRKGSFHGFDLQPIVADRKVDAAVLGTVQRYRNLSYGLPVRIAEKQGGNGAALKLR